MTLFDDDMAIDEEGQIHASQAWTDDEGYHETSDGDLEVNSQPHEQNGTTTTTFPIPVWMRESSKSFRWRWIPLPLRKAGRAVMKWARGPQPPMELDFEPIFPAVQEWPIKMMDKYVPKRRHRMMLLGLLYIFWFVPWALVLRHSQESGQIKGFGKPTNIWCGYNEWNWDNRCGLNGNNCRPFGGVAYAFRCPASCDSVQVYEPRWVGDVEVQYSNYVVGGPSINESTPIYRADSFICQAAIHAGVIDNTRGGCGVVAMAGSALSYTGSKRHGIESVDFPTSFPKSFTFLSGLNEINCPRDSRWPSLLVTIVPLALLFLFSTSPSAIFFSTFFILFLHVAMVSDPPSVGPTPTLISILLSRLLPATFIVYILYRTSVIPLLKGCTAQIEKTVFYLGLCLIGALNNYTFAPLIPIQRLTPHDMAQPGAKFALVVIIALLLSIAGGQIYWMRQSGVFLKYLKVYVTMAVTLVILLLLPGLRLRIHHYILAMLFIPGTGIRIRPSLFYQGLLLGLFINGIARWGFASIVQTPDMLGENPSGSSGNGGGGRWWGSYKPNVTAVVAPDVRNITFNWGSLPVDIGIEGVSVLVNDVERYRAYLDDDLGSGWWGSAEGFTWKRKKGSNETDFFRFAWMRGSSTGLYTNAGTWAPNGSWIAPGDEKETNFEHESGEMSILSA